MEPNEKPTYEELEKRLEASHKLRRNSQKRAAKANDRNIELNTELHRLRRQIRTYELNYQNDDSHARQLKLAEERLDLIADLADRGSKPRPIRDAKVGGVLSYGYVDTP